MKKKDRNLLLGAGVLAAGAWYLTKKKDGTSVSGIPGIGAILPTNSLVPEKYRGACSPVWLDAALWGGVGLAAG
ncbi:MAG TPA: hypothetical protein VGQ57_06100, partial [Polyangiaceae bacterium]|nr:hypothetical protein [Polyangiaceae bacterium]